MWQAVLALVGVVIGGVLAGGVALRQVQLFTDREHAARQAEREQARKDARDAFQRDTILALQDAVADLWRMVVDLHGEAVNAQEKMSHWRRQAASVSFGPASMSSLYASRACALASSMTHFVASSLTWPRLPWAPSTLATGSVRRT